MTSSSSTFKNILIGFCFLSTFFVNSSSTTPSPDTRVKITEEDRVEIETSMKNIDHELGNFLDLLAQCRDEYKTLKASENASSRLYSARISILSSTVLTQQAILNSVRRKLAASDFITHCIQGNNNNRTYKEITGSDPLKQITNDQHARIRKMLNKPNHTARAWLIEQLRESFKESLTALILHSNDFKGVLYLARAEESDEHVTALLNIQNDIREQRIDDKTLATLCDNIVRKAAAATVDFGSDSLTSQLCTTRTKNQKKRDKYKAQKKREKKEQKDVHNPSDCS